MNRAASFLAPTCLSLGHQAMAAIFFEPEQLAHEQLLLGTRGDDAGAGAGVPVVPEFYRAKGLFEVAGSERMHALQAVQSTYELVEGPPWSEAHPHCQECLARRGCHAATHRHSVTRERRAALWAREERPRASGSGEISKGRGVPGRPRCARVELYGRRCLSFPCT